MKIVFVYNPKSGSALSRGELRKKCEAAGIEVEKFIAIGDGFERKLAPYIKRAKHIAVIGGDGTISAVAGRVAGSKAVLIPLPGGTLNHFTKDLGIPQDIDEALGRLGKLRPRKVDIGCVNDILFVNNSSMGLYPTTLHSRDDLEDTVGKWPAAVVASLRALVRFKTYRVTIGDAKFVTPFIFVGNNRYSLDEIGGTERTRLDEGCLTVFTTRTQSRFTLLKIAAFALFGKAKELPHFDEFHPEKLVIETKHRKLSVSHDGEVSRLVSPLKYRIRPGALTILG